MKRCLIFAGVLSVFLFMALLGAVLPKGAEGNTGYVGMNKCKECHGDAVEAFGKTLHGRALAGKSKDSAGSCESCHGPGGQHAANPSKATILSFGKKSQQSAAAQSKACLSCHRTNPELAYWDMGKHKKKDVACDSCHSVHAKKAAKEHETCFTCHKDVRSQVNKLSRHPILEGKVKCTDCHNSHGTLSHGMIKADNINQLCYKCHASKRGPFVWEHPPVEENCATCHLPHGSKAAKLMVQKIPNLCQDCHDWQRHPGTIYSDRAGFKGSSPSNRFLARSCLNCHNTIHGSNAPTNPAGTYGAGKFLVR